MALATYIDKIKLQSCIYNAAGCLDTTKSDLDNLHQSKSAAVLIKSSTLLSRQGNELPRFYINDTLSINSMGIPNLGLDFYINYDVTYHSDNTQCNSKQYIYSIAPFSCEEMIIMLTKINDNIEKHFDENSMRIVEINLSCPNIKNKSVTIFNNQIFESYLDELRKTQYNKLLIGLKLPALFMPEQFDYISSLIKRTACIKFITCCNSLCNGLVIDPELEKPKIKPKNGLGGIGGDPLKAISLANVREFYIRLSDYVSIIGCGGINTGTDIFEYILCGASAVQIGTAFIREKHDIYSRLETELNQIMKTKKYSCIDDFKGKLCNI